MSHGIYRCYGTIPHIKQKYGEGYDFFVKLNLPSAQQKAEIATQMLAGLDAHVGASQAMGRTDPDSIDNPEAYLEAQQVIDRLRKVLSDAAQTKDENHGWMQEVFQLLWTKDSPFPGISRLAAKAGVNSCVTQEAVRSENLGTEKCKVGVLSEWLCRAKWNVNLVGWVQATFANSALLERQMGIGTVTFRISDLDKDALSKGQRQKRSLGSLFGEVEKVRGMFHIGEYAVTPTTLEQIFNTFTREDMNVKANGTLGTAVAGSPGAAVGAPVMVHVDATVAPLPQPASPSVATA
eukprot:gene101-20_t